jgi:O-methyltransferase
MSREPDSGAIRIIPRRGNGAAFPRDFSEWDIELYRAVGPFTMTSPECIYALTQAVRYIVRHEIPGAIVECGVWRGGSMMAVAHTLRSLNRMDRQLYLFDTFTGMTPPTAEDVMLTGEPASALLAQSSKASTIWAVSALDTVQHALSGVGYPGENLHFVEGDVEQTLPASAPEEIALLRLDTDWYASTKHELIHLFPRLVRGGIIIIDDYGHWLGARQATDEYLTEHNVPLLLNRINYTARIGVKI